MAMGFNLATDRVSYTGGTAPDTTTGIAFTCWAYLTVDRNDFSAIFRLWSGALGTRVNLATGSNGETPGLFSAGNTGGVNSPMSLVLGGWRALGCSITGTTGTIFCADSTLGTVQTANGTVSGGAAAAGYTFGGRDTGDATEWFNGRMAYARMWSSTMTQGEMVSEWGSTTLVRSSGIWASYPLSTGSDLADVSGNGRNLTAGSTAGTTETGPPIPLAGLSDSLKRDKQMRLGALLQM